MSENEKHKKLISSLCAVLTDFMEYVGEPPEKNCRCHISPPCSDCVDHIFMREAFENAKNALNEAEAINELE